MPFAMCFDTGMLVGILLTFLALGAVCVAPIIFALVALGRWSSARQKRTATES